MIAAGAVLLILLSTPGFPEPESRADYSIEAFLDTDSHTVTATAEITFHNGSGFSVDTLWLHLYPNAYRDTSSAFAGDLDRACRFEFRRSSLEDKGWIDLEQWTVRGEPAEITTDGTLCSIPLAEPLAHGDSLVLSGGFTVKIPAFWSRMGRYRETYQITQWYPKMCALDARGWHLSRYHASGEFFSDFGEYSVSLNVPGDFITAATGRIAEETFDEDSTRRTEHWTAVNVHDFAWSASPCYIVEDHLFNYPEGGGTVRVHLVMLDSAEDYWQGMAEAVDSSLAFFGEWYMPYPYRDLWVVDPVIPGSGGMEYPQFVFSSFSVPRSRARELVTIHEVGHQWFYGILASNEVEEAWLDEGMTSFSEIRCMERLYGLRGNVSSTPDWLLSLSDRDMQTSNYASGVTGETVPVLSRATGAGDGSYSPGFTYYTKPSLFLSMLHSELGDSTFHSVMQTYFRRFAFHHPHTEDFQAIVEETSGRDWTLEFDYWLMGTGSADCKITELQLSPDSTSAFVESSFPHGVNIPVLFTDGTDSLFSTVALRAGESANLSVQGRWQRAVVDPFQMYPDSAPWNNSFPADIRLKPLILPVPIASHHSLWALPFPWSSGDGLRFNAALLATPLPAESGGPYTAASVLSIPLDKTDRTSWTVYFGWPGETGYGKTTLFTAGAGSGFGYSRVNAGFRRTLFGPTRSHGEDILELGIELITVDDSDVFPGEDMTSGGWLTGRIKRGMSLRNFNWVFRGNFTASMGVSSDRTVFGGAEITGELGDYQFNGFSGATRLFAGLTAGEVPPRYMMRAGGALFEHNILLGSILPTEGVLSPSEHFLIPEGPALPGYGSSRLRGDAGFSLQQSFFNGSIPVGLYAGTGWVGDLFSPGQLPFISDAGFVVEAGLLRAIFPVWVSSPPQGEKTWEFRWRISVGN